MASQAKKATAIKTATAGQEPSPAAKSVAGANPAVIYIPVAKLHWSSRNARQTPIGDVSDLKASILALGGRLLQNLVVVKEGDGHGVVAGGRRLQALQELIQEKLLPASIEAACVEVADSEALEVSLIENLQRVAMHPADEFTAFAGLIEQGRSIAQVGTLFRVEPAYVKRRLALGTLSPKVLARFRADELDIDHVTALTLTDDHALQESIACEGKRVPQPWQIKEQLTKGTVRASDKRARFVGVKAYQKAGGGTHSDLFAGRGDIDENSVETRLTDSGLLQRLAVEKLTKLGEEWIAKHGGAWLDVDIDFDAFNMKGYDKAPAVLRAETAEEAAERKRLEAEGERLDKLMENDDDDDGELYAQRDEVWQQLSQIEDRRRETPAELAELIGVVATLKHDGKAEFHAGLIRDADKKRAKQIAAQSAGEGGGSVASVTAAGDNQTEPQSLMQELTAIRSAVIRDALATETGYALRLLAFQLWGTMQRNYTGSHVHISGTAWVGELAKRSPTMAGSPLHVAEIERAEAWAAKLGGDDLDAAWLWCKSADEGEILALLGYCTAAMFDDVRQFVSNDNNRSRAMLSDLSVDVASHWKPTAENYFGRLRKDPLIQLLGAHAPTGADKTKRAALAAIGEDKLGGAGWMPEVMRPLAD